MYVHEKKVGVHMVIIPLKATNLFHFLCFFGIKGSVWVFFYCEITMPSDFIKRSTTRSTCRHVKNYTVTSGKVKTFDGCFRALPENTERLRLSLILIFRKSFPCSVICFILGNICSKFQSFFHMSFHLVTLQMKLCVA